MGADESNPHSQRIGLQVSGIEMQARADIHVFDAMPDFERPDQFARLMKIWVGKDGSIYVRPKMPPGQEMNAVAKGDLNRIPESENLDLTKKLLFISMLQIGPNILQLGPSRKCHSTLMACVTSVVTVRIGPHFNPRPIFRCCA